ncbi:MAG: cytochrome P450 [Myxococcota bacterium]
MVATEQMAVLPGTTWLGHVGALREDPLPLLTLGARLGEDILRLRLGPVKAFVVYGPDAIRQVLVESPEKFGRNTRGSILLRRTLGVSTLTAEGDEWRWRRRLAQPSFKRDLLKPLDGPIVALADRMAEQLLAETGPFDLAHVTSQVALDVACAALFGADLGDDAAVVHRALTEVLAGFIPFATHPIPNLDRLPTPNAIKFRAARQDLAGVVARIVARRRERGDLGQDLLGAWLAGARPDGTPLTDVDLDAEGVTMLLAGHETTANAMAFTFGLLARHPSVHRRLRAELASVLGDRPATSADLDQLPFLDAVVKEGLRLYPPAWILSRSTNEDVTIAGHPIPKGSFLYVPIYAVHRLPSLWDDPEGFDPERWLDGRAEVARKAGAYLPFGFGQRRCVGEPLALLEARLVLAQVVRKVHLELSPGQSFEPEVSVTLRPRGGMWMTAKPVGASVGATTVAAPARTAAAPAGCPHHAK